MANPNFETWKSKVLGKVLKIDDNSADCVDVPKSWAEFGTGKPWTTSFCWGNAKDLYTNAPSAYWQKLPKGNTPKPGDVFVMNGNTGGGFGHTGVVVSVNGGNMTVFQQNTFTQQPVYTGVYSWNSSLITGFLRPKFAFDVSAATLAGNQRVVGGDGVYYRKSASRSGEVVKLYAAGEVLDFKGYVRGESVDGNNIWFVGAYTGYYAHSSGFTDISIHDLPDITPSVSLLPNQRQIGDDAMNYRKSPKVEPDNVIQVFPAGDVLDFKGYVHGQMIDGNDVWFVGAYSGGYIHSSGFKDTGTHDLQDLTGSTTPPTTPTVPDLSTKVIDISSNNTVVDYNLIKSSVRGVVAKAGHTGVSYGGIQPINKDPTFEKNKSNLGDKLVGAYWYGYASLDAKTEADAFVESVGDVSDSFTYWLDMEESDGVSNEKVNTWAQTFMARVDELTNQVCGLYTYRNWYNTVINDTTKGTRPIWLAHYDVTEFYQPVPNQVAHQYTSKGSVPGLSGNIDINAVKEEFFVPIVINEPDVPTEPEEPDVPTTPGEPNEPDTSTDNAKVEAMKLLGRQGILASVSALITALANWALISIAGLNLPSDVLIALGGAVYAGLLYIDKWLHEKATIKIKGIIGF